MYIFMKNIVMKKKINKKWPYVQEYQFNPPPLQKKKNSPKNKKNKNSDTQF